MDYYGNNDWRDYHLSHYGVKGMKKGKHLPGTDWWKDAAKDQITRDNAYALGAARRLRKSVIENRRKTDRHLKGGLLNVGGGKLAAYDKKGKKQVFKNPAANSNSKSVAGNYEDAFGMAKKGKKFFTTTRMVKPNAVSLDPGTNKKKKRKLTGEIVSSKKAKAVDSVFTRMGAKPGSLLKAIASGKVQATSMKKGGKR